MAFLIEDDYAQVIKDDILQQVVEEDPIAKIKAEKTAIKKVASSLSSRYNTNAIFSAQGDSRDELIVQLVIDIMLYDLHARIDPIAMPEIRRERYKNAISELDKIANGLSNPIGLPLLTNDEGSVEIRNRYGSDQPFISKW